MENIHIHTPKTSFAWHVLVLLIPVTIFALIIAGVISHSNSRNAMTTQAVDTSTQDKKTIVLNGQTITADIADTDTERAKGLGGRSSLDDSQGLLFDFTQQTGVPGFWMKDMLIPIDIIWIKDGKVIFINKNVPAQPQDIIYKPTNVTDIDYVLEVPAGWSDRYGVSVETQIDL